MYSFSFLYPNKRQFLPTPLLFSHMDSLLMIFCLAQALNIETQSVKQSVQPDFLQNVIV